MGIPYIGLSKEVCDLPNPHHMHQVMMWANERKALGESIHIWGLLPCTPWCSWQHLNKHCLNEDFEENLEARQDESRVLVTNSSSLTEVALESGCSSSFEGPRWCSGWQKVEELTDMIAKHDMYPVYPCGCAFDLTIKGLRPLKS